jgi:hypothetical protein
MHRVPSREEKLLKVLNNKLQSLNPQPNNLPKNWLDPGKKDLVKDMAAPQRQRREKGMKLRTDYLNLLNMQNRDYSQLKKGYKNLPLKLDLV